MEGPTITKVAVERLRERRDISARCFESSVLVFRETKAIAREWKAATDPKAKAALYARLRTICLAHRSYAPLLVMYEGAVEDYEAALARSA